MSENPSTRINSYKNNSKSSQEMRQRRQEVSIELRKAKRDDQLQKRRNIETVEPTSPLQENNGQSPIINLSIDEITGNIKHSNPTLQFQAVQAVRKMLSREKNPPIDTIIGLGFVPTLINYLGDFENQAIQFEAAWALTNIASGTSEQTKAVISAGAIPKFIALLCSPVPNVAEQAVWALGNVAGDGPEARDIVLANGVVECLLQLIRSDTLELSFLRNIVWLMSNLCRNKNPTPSFDKVKLLLPALANLLDHNDKMILSDVCWALSYVTDDTTEKIQAVVDSGCIPRLVWLLGCDDPAIVTPALRSVGNIVTGDDTQTDIVLKCNVLACLENLFNHKKSNIIKEAAWTVSNITAGNQHQIQQVIESDILSSILHVLRCGDFKAQREAVWAVTNITSGGTSAQIIQMIEKYPVIKPYTDLLLSKDARTVVVVLNGLQALFRVAEAANGLKNFCIMLEELGVVDKLEALQTHENQEIYEKSYKIIEAYFSDGDDEDEKKLAPKVNADSLEFSSHSGGAGSGNNFNF
ncbi:CLUMA_CG006479, isoform A [Clunio marinus]|uniref:Importin subunit alpha n=1 Tax=Clunio marinus TaxID=568069 RepID=A0A1J1HZT3_9DIPT|nr:CLUMA_CG006479, isoform A [Clunio marinus]